MGGGLSPPSTLAAQFSTRAFASFCFVLFNNINRGDGRECDG